MPHPPVAARHRRLDRVRRARRALFDRFLAGMLAGLRELTLFLAPNINSYKRYAALLVRARRRWRGATTTAPARCASSATAPAGAIECRVAGRRRQPLPRAQRADRRRPARRRRGARARAGAARATPTRPTSARRSRARCATPATCSRRARSRATRSARRSSTTTSTTRASSSRPTTRRSRTGSASGASSVCRRRVVLVAQILQQGAQARGDRVHLLARPADRFLELPAPLLPIPPYRPTVIPAVGRPLHAIHRPIRTTGRSGL